jgi:hypothetical protein
MSLLRCVDVRGLAGGSGGTNGTHTELRLALAAEQVKCFESWQWVLIVLLVAVLFPFPILLFVRVRRKQERQQSTRQGMLGAELAVVRVLEGPFKQSVIARNWELVVLGRRFLLLALYTFVQDPFWQAAALAICNVAILAAHLVVAPFRQPLEQRVETVSLSLLVLLSVLNVGSGASSGGAVGQLQQVLLLTPLILAGTMLMYVTCKKRGWCASDGPGCGGAFDCLVLTEGGAGQDEKWQSSAMEELEEEKQRLRKQLAAKDAREQQLEAETGQLKAQLKAETGQLKAQLTEEAQQHKTETGQLKEETGQLKEETGQLKEENRQLLVELTGLRQGGAAAARD